jgi:membrane protein
MSGVMNVPVLGRALRAAEARMLATWSRDRATMRFLPAAATRVARIAVLVGRGVVVHRLGMLAAALTYYTVFSIVPMLAMLVWTLRVLDYLPAIARGLPATPQLASGNDLFYAALRKVLEAVDRTSEVTTGLVGLGVLLIAVSKMFKQTERALHVIAGSRPRLPSLWRLLGYVVLLLVPPVALAISGISLALLKGSLGARIPILGSIPGIELAIGTALGVAALWMSVTMLYWAAVRARIPFVSAVVGGGVAAVALPVVLWAFANFQIGMSQASAIGSGILALPVFLLWVFSSWAVVLVGAEIAVADRAERVLVHGAVAFRLDAEGERQTGAAIMARVTHAARAAGGADTGVSDDQLARELRLPSHLIRDLCERLAARGLLVEEHERFRLDCDPDQTSLAAVIDAVDRDPSLEPAHDEALARFQPPTRQALARPPAPARDAARTPTLAELARQWSPVGAG